MVKRTLDNPQGLATKAKPLTLHINTAQKRKKREMSKEMVEAARTMASEKQVDGYAIVAWTKGFSHATTFNSGDTLPAVMVPEYVKGALQHRIYKNLNEG